LRPASSRPELRALLERLVAALDVLRASFPADGCRPYLRSDPPRAPSERPFVKANVCEVQGRLVLDPQAQPAPLPQQALAPSELSEPSVQRVQQVPMAPLAALLLASLRALWLRALPRLGGRDFGAPRRAARVYSTGWAAAASPRYE